MWEVGPKTIVVKENYHRLLLSKAEDTGDGLYKKLVKWLSLTDGHSAAIIQDELAKRFSTKSKLYVLSEPHLLSVVSVTFTMPSSHH